MTFNWWQAILAGIVIFGIGFGVRHFTYKCPIPQAINVPGIPDTVYIPMPAYTGTSQQTVASVPVDELKDSITLSWMYEAITDTTFPDGSHLYFRSRTYPYIEDDSLKAEIVHEFNLTPAPITEIYQTDTTYVPTQLEECEVPFFEKPAVLVPLAYVAGIATAIIILNNIKD